MLLEDNLLVIECKVMQKYCCNSHPRRAVRLTATTPEVGSMTGAYTLVAAIIWEEWLMNDYREHTLPSSISTWRGLTLHSASTVARILSQGTALQ